MDFRTLASGLFHQTSAAILDALEGFAVAGALGTLRASGPEESPVEQALRQIADSPLRAPLVLSTLPLALGANAARDVCDGFLYRQRLRNTLPLMPAGPGASLELPARLLRKIAFEPVVMTDALAQALPKRRPLTLLFIADGSSNTDPHVLEWLEDTLARVTGEMPRCAVLPISERKAVKRQFAVYEDRLLWGNEDDGRPIRADLVAAVNVACKTYDNAGFFAKHVAPGGALLLQRSYVFDAMVRRTPLDPAGLVSQLTGPFVGNGFREVFRSGRSQFLTPFAVLTPHGTVTAILQAPQ